jgi:hypothetical protein
MKHILILLVTMSTMLPACGGADGLLTQSGREYQEEFSGALCSRIVECNGGGSVAACVDLMVGEWCAALPQYCDDNHTISEDSWNSCVSAMYTFSCEAILEGRLPIECDEAERVIGL